MIPDDTNLERTADPSPLPAALQARPDARALLLALRRRWLLACCLAVMAAVGAAGATWLFLPLPRPTAQALLHVETHQPWIVEHKGESRTDFHNYQKTQIALVKSRLVLNAALRQPEVAELPLVREPIDPIAWLQRELLVDFSTAPEILRIGMTGYPPDQMKVLVAHVTRAYLDEIVKREDNKRRNRFEQLKEIHERYQETLRTKRRTLRELVENVGSGDPHTLALKQRFAQEQLALAEKELLQVESDLRRLQTEWTLHQTRGDALEEVPLTDGDLDELLKKDPTAERLSQRRAQVQQDILEALRVAARGDQEPRVQHLRTELALAEKALADHREQMKPLLATQIQERLRRQRQAQRETLAERLQLLTELRKNLANDVTRLSQETRTLNKGSLDIESYKQDIAQIEETAKKVAHELETLSVEMKAVPRVTELESAAITQPDDARRRILATVVAGLAGLFLTAFLVSWCEYRGRRVQSPEEVVYGLGIQLVGTVPEWSHKPADTAVPDQPVPITWDIDSLDATRAMVLHAARVHATRVLLVTSAVAGEGKTSLACRLAVSLARANRKTLLIDGDLRNPTTHRFFRLQEQPGISEVLAQGRPVEEVIQATAFQGLAFIAAGQATVDALQALTQETLRRVLDSLRDQYDFIVIDSCPVLPVADTLLLGQQVDGVILSVLRDVSQLHRVYAAHQALTRLNVRILGAVVNGTHSTLPAPEYRYLRQRQEEPAAVTMK